MQLLEHTIPKYSQSCKEDSVIALDVITFPFPAFKELHFDSIAPFKKNLF
jgi:hypothetical protein